MANDKTLDELLSQVGQLLRGSHYTEYAELREAWKKYWRINGDQKSGAEEANKKNATRRKNQKGRPTS